MAQKSEAEMIADYKAEIAKIVDPVERRAKDRHFRIWLKRLQRNPNRRPIEATHEVLTATVPVKTENGKQKMKTLSVVVSKDKTKHVPQPSNNGGQTLPHPEQVSESAS